MALEYFRGTNPGNEQMVFINAFYEQFGHRINAVQYLHLQGAFAGSEILTYAATKLYVCFSLVAQHTGAINTTAGSIQYYNEANVLNGYITNNNFLYEPVTPTYQYLKQMIEMKNFYFARVVNNQYSYFKFTGLRIIYT